MGHLGKLSVSLPDPTDVLELLQDSNVASLTLVMSHLRPMVRDCVSKCLVLWSAHFCSIQLILCLVLHYLQTPHDQVRLQALVSGVKSEKVSIVLKQERHFPYSSARLALISSNLGMRLVCVVCVYSTLHCTCPCGIPVRSWSHTVSSTWWHTDPLRRTKSLMNWMWTEFSECVCTVHCSACGWPTPV